MLVGPYKVVIGESLPCRSDNIRAMNQAVEVVRTVNIAGAAAFKHQLTEEAPFPFGWQGGEDILLVDSEVG